MSEKQPSRPGPGDLETRIARARKGVEPGQVREAETLADTKSFALLKLAYYLASQKKAVDDRKKRINKHKTQLEALTNSRVSLKK